MGMAYILLLDILHVLGFGGIPSKFPCSPVVRISNNCQPIPTFYLKLRMYVKRRLSITDIDFDELLETIQDFFLTYCILLFFIFCNSPLVEINVIRHSFYYFILTDHLILMPQAYSIDANNF
jgi:hypothetical protein